MASSLAAGLSRKGPKACGVFLLAAIQQVLLLCGHFLLLIVIKGHLPTLSGSYDALGQLCRNNRNI